MKKCIIVLALIFIISFQCVAQTTTREELYEQSGPVLTEAIVRVTMDEINLIRVELGMGTRTNQQLMNAIKNKLDSLDPYEFWEDE